MIALLLIYHRHSTKSKKKAALAAKDAVAPGGRAARVCGARGGGRRELSSDTRGRAAPIDKSAHAVRGRLRALVDT
jgi:hypothetical protein